HRAYPGRALCKEWHPRHRCGALAPCAQHGQSMSAALLETQGLCRSFGALEVARDINFKLERGARHALIGPNGAGKTTFINLLTGVLPPSRGCVLLEGEDVKSL